MLDLRASDLSCHPPPRNATSQWYSPFSPPPTRSSSRQLIDRCSDDPPHATLRPCHCHCHCHLQSQSPPVLWVSLAWAWPGLVVCTHFIFFLVSRANLAARREACARRLTSPATMAHFIAHPYQAYCLLGHEEVVATGGQQHEKEKKNQKKRK